MLTRAAILAGVGLSACSWRTGDLTVAPEHGITQDIKAARSRS
jgi:hypothetical protein